MSKPVFELPKIASELIRIAVKDARTSVSQGYKIDMDSWGALDYHNIDNPDPKIPQHCSVCFAGSVMLQRDPTKDKLNPESFNCDSEDPNEEQYNFLDAIRMGELQKAMCKLNIQYPFESNGGLTSAQFVRNIEGFKEYDEFAKENNIDGFFQQMEGIAEDLEEMGY